jgi:ribonuclease R
MRDREKIYKKLNNGPMRYKKLESFFSNKKSFRATFKKMKNSGEIFSSGDYAVLSGGKMKGCKELAGTVVKLTERFGFVRCRYMDEDVFISGADMMGALPGDEVIILITEKSERGYYGIITKITKEKSTFSGLVKIRQNKKYISISCCDFLQLPADNLDKVKADIGDSVTVAVKGRGRSHFKLYCHIKSVIGKVESAKQSVELLLAENELEKEFPKEVTDQAKKVKSTFDKKEADSRRDLRIIDMFTIDSASAKDMDDAVFAQKTETGYMLIVSIADVSYYVEQNSSVDKEAFNRGNSVYFGESVIPMLPLKYSNGVCSLNPGEDKLAFSCKIDFDKSGKIIKYEFFKSVINSRIKGVYSEINSIFDKSANEDTLKKYSDVKTVIEDEYELYNVLKENHELRGAMSIESSESKFKFENGVAIDVSAAENGAAEDMIEEFMLSANNCAAMFLKEKNIPGIYRVHPPIDSLKLDLLKESLSKFDLYINTDNGKTLQQNLSELLDKTRNTNLQIPVHKLILRSQSKAKYSDVSAPHFGLVLEDYSHFTSPIRRYADLSIHRIMSDCLRGEEKSELQKKYEKFAKDRADKATEREAIALNVERGADDIYKAEIMSEHLGQSFEGIITSVTIFGVYVTLPNTVEGLVHRSLLNLVQPELTEGYSLSCPVTGEKYIIGQKMTVTVVNVDILNGNVDFSPAADSVSAIDLSQTTLSELREKSDESAGDDKLKELLNDYGAGNKNRRAKKKHKH